MLPLDCRLSPLRFQHFRRLSARASLPRYFAFSFSLRLFSYASFRRFCLFIAVAAAIFSYFYWSYARHYACHIFHVADCCCDAMLLTLIFRF